MQSVTQNSTKNVQKQQQNQNSVVLSQQQSNHIQISDQVDVQTAQFIKTNTFIQQSNHNNANSIINLQNSYQSNIQQQKKGSLSNNSKKISLSKEPLAISINQILMQNQSICQGTNEESIDKSFISQGNQQQKNQWKLNKQMHFRKKSEKLRFKQILLSRNIQFLAILILLFQADSIYIFSNVFEQRETSLVQQIFFYILIISQSIMACIFMILSLKSSVFLYRFLKERQIYFIICSILIQLAYHENILIILRLTKHDDLGSNDEKITNLSLLPFRLLNIFIMSHKFQILIKINNTKSLIQFTLLLYFSIRFFLLQFQYNYIEIVVFLVASISIYINLKVSNNFYDITNQLKQSNKFQHLLSTNNQNIASNNNNLNYFITSAQPSAKGSIQDRIIDDGLEMAKLQSFNNNSLSQQGPQLSQPFLIQSQLNQNQMNSHQKQLNINQTISFQNFQNKNLSDIQSMNTNNLIMSQNSLNNSFTNLEKPLAPLENNMVQSLQSNKRSQFANQNNLLNQQYHQDINGNNLTSQNKQILQNEAQNTHKIEKQHQMSKIIELDLENEFSKQNNNNSISPGANNQNGFSQMEQKSLIEQLIEVDGVLVFEQETQQVVFANQNILNLLETDTNRILQELMILKQINFPSDEKSMKEGDYSTSNILKHLLKDTQISPLLSSLVISSYQNTSKASHKINSNPYLNRVIEEENEQDQSPQGSLVRGVQSQNVNSVGNEEQNQSFSRAIGDSIRQINRDTKSLSTVQQSQGTIQYFKPIKQIKSLLQSNSFNNKSKKENYIYTKSRSHHYKSNPSQLQPNSDSQQEDEDDIQKNKFQPTESIFKKLQSQQQSISVNNYQGQHESNIDSYLQQSNQNELQSFVLNKYNRETIDSQFPSSLSSISQIPHRSTVNQNSFNTIERERSSTLKDIMDDVRSKSGTVFANQRKISANQLKKKILNNRKLLNYSSQPETVINNMVLFKENTTKIYLMKYSIVEHAGKVLHILCIRDLSHQIFEQILDRQSSVLIDELYKYLNFTEISQVLNRSVKQMKEFKYKIQQGDYKQMVKPMKLNLKLFNYLMKDIYDVRSLQQKSFSLNKDYFDLQSELLYIKKMTESLMNNVIFNFYYDKQIPIQILNDKDRITQILMNLLVNCCKFVKNNKIFLKAKMCNEQNMIKIIIQNRELDNNQREQILKSFNHQTNSLGYHFFISNQLAKQVSNQKYNLEIISNKQEYVKFRFHIYLFTQISPEFSEVQLIKPSFSTDNQKGKTSFSNTISLENKNDFELPKQNSKSLYHIEIDKNLSFGSQLTKHNDNKLNDGPQINVELPDNSTSLQIKDFKLHTLTNNQQNKQKQNNDTETMKKDENPSFQFLAVQDHQEELIVNSTISISNEGLQLSEQVENHKIKDFDSIQERNPMKFITDITS